MNGFAVQSSITERTERFSMGAYGGVLVVVWHGTPTLNDFDVLERATGTLAENSADGVGLLIVIEEGNDKPPPPQVRKRHGALVTRFADELWGMARVVEGTGLKKSVVRFALSTIDMFSTSNVPERTVDTVQAATDWLVSIRPELNVFEIVTGVNEMRGQRRARAS